MNITRPTLLLDENQCRTNIMGMVMRANNAGVRLRPHFKTHQSRAVGEWFREEGVKAITVSSVEMAYYFADSGWTDITIAFPVNLLELPAIDYLLENGVKLNLVVESVEVVEGLRQGITLPVGVYVKIDTGAVRTGLPVNRPDLITPVVKALNDFPLVRWKGFLAHAGNSYRAAGVPHVQLIQRESVAAMNRLRDFYAEDYPDIELSLGDTPSAVLGEDWTGINELRPGVFAFNDLMMLGLDACKIHEIAICMACPVVAIHEERNEVIIYGGAVHFSKDHLKFNDGTPLFGRIVTLKKNRWEPEFWPDTWLRSVSQEHGIIRTSPEQLKYFKVGKPVGILPVHACLTANLMGGYLTMGGKRIDHLRKPRFTYEQLIKRKRD